MTEGRIKHLFPGGNTSQGFFSYYTNIIELDQEEHLYIIKGGPGVGKSTFMKKIGEEMLKKGFDIEHLHCSSDNESLDGVKIPALKMAFIDGTSPHVVDPKYPGAVDEIINFGMFWNEEGIRKHKKDIIKISGEISGLFNRAYRYLKAAYSIYEDSHVLYQLALKEGEINLFTKNLVEEKFSQLPLKKELGKARCLFASAITPNGLCHYLNNLITVEDVYILKGSLGTGENHVLESMKKAALDRGCHIECYYCAFNPHKLEHLIIPEINLALTTKNDYHSYEAEQVQIIDLNQFYNSEILSLYQEKLNQNRNIFDYLLSVALETISGAKMLHDSLERYYIPNIDFKGIDACFEKVMHSILANIK